VGLHKRRDARLQPARKANRQPDNAYIEAFNGRFRAECLNAHWFLTLADAAEKDGELAQILQ
jgi:hypothetical protein